MQAGQTVQRYKASGFDTRCTVKNGKGVYDVLGYCKDVETGRRHLTKDFVKYFLYGYGRMLWDMAGVHCLYGDSKSTITHFASQEAGMRILEHRDSCDICPQLITTYGNYEGGILEVFVENICKWVSVDTRNRPTLVEGRMRHRVTRVTRGTRYVIITFKNTDSDRSNPWPLLATGYLR